MKARSGLSVPEMLVALLVGLLVVNLSLRVLAGARTALATLTERAETLSTLRIGRHALRAELRVAEPGRDWVPPGADSIALRAFRGVGLACPEHPSPAELFVSFSGVREPDPEKDSVLVLAGDGAWASLKLEEAGATALRCPDAPEVAVQRWRLSDPPPAGATLVRLFERGSYHVSDRALRYARGASGRQPLSPEVLDTRASGFSSRGAGVALALVPRAGRGRAWLGPLRAVARDSVHE